MSDVEDFLKRFHLSKDIDVVFTCGCCYWFAQILFRRFIRDGAVVMYSSDVNHFGTKIHGRVYDITGDVTDKYKWASWTDFSDEIEKKRIIRDCVMF